MQRELEIKKAANLIQNGGIVIFPTETVYGIGANGLDSKAVEKIYKVKNRNKKNPINLLVDSLDMIETIAKDITDLEYKLINTFFPGPLTIILKRKKNVPDIVTAGNDTVGIRMPSGETALNLVKEAGVPIAAPSANLSGKISGTNIEDIIEDFKDKVDYIINGGDCDIGLESTIVKVIDEVPHILRPGAITDEQIKAITNNIVLDYEQDNKLLPSNTQNHYKTFTKSILVYNDDEQQQINEVNKLANKYKNAVIISCNEHVTYYKDKNVLKMGSRANLNEISKSIFKLLKKADNLCPDIIIVEGVNNDGIGKAIMDRLKKTCC